VPAAIIYARISHDEDGDHLGVDRQERLCRELAQHRGLTIVDVLVDNDVSAYRRKRRPQFERLVDMLKSGEAEVVVVYHADRLYRRLVDLERLVEVVEVTGAQVHTVAAGDVDMSTASGRMVARMLGAAAQHESERIGERMKMKHDELAAKGSAPGGRAPYGYTRGMLPDKEGRVRKTYVVVPAEADALREMARLVLEGASQLAIARWLDSAGVPSREGRPWHGASARAALLNPAITGLRVHRREIAGPGDWEPILDRATWEEVRAVLADPSRRRTRPARKYLLAGLVFNAVGDQLNGGPDITGRLIYTTRFPAKQSMQIGAHKLEELVVEAVLVAFDKATLPSVQETTPAAGAEVVELEGELAELAALRGAGTISLAEWLAAREPLQQRLDDARRAAGTVRRRTTRTTRLFSKPGAVRKAWPELDFAAQREILAAVIERIVIGRATRGRWTPVLDRVDIRWRA
jgi:DNA invertase Pin-like site-specific DNA recombinase